MERKIKARAFKFDAPVNAACFTRDGSAFAFGLGSGLVHVVAGNTRKDVPAHKGAVPCLKPFADNRFASLSDDGTLALVSADGTFSQLADFKGAWTERMDTHENGALAVAVGREVHVWTKEGADMRKLAPHDGTVTDVCFAPDGLGLACAHRNGVTLWAWPHFEPQALPLPWKGAHLAITLSPDKRWVVTAMQEGALHLWNLPLKRDYQMNGYWGKPTALAWSADRKWLATSGAETVVIWPFDRMGPEGREPLQLGWSNGAPVSAVCAHPSENVFAAGFGDGGVVLVDVDGKRAFTAAAPSGYPISALAFSPDGRSLIAGTLEGGGILFDFT